MVAVKLKNIGSTWAWSICILLLLATMLNYMDRQALAVILPTLKQDFNLAEGRVGMLEGCFGFAFAFGSILFGWLADKFGPRLLYPIILVGWSLAGIATAAAGQPEWMAMLESEGDLPGTGVYRWLLFCRITLGVFEAGHWPCALLTVRAILEAKDRPLGNGILQSGASIGAISVPLYIQVAEYYGQSWEFPFWSIGVLGLVWVPFWFLIVGKADLLHAKESPAPELKNPPGLSEADSPQDSTFDLYRRILTLGIIVSTLVVSWQFLRAWLGLFLQDYHGYSKENTRFLMSCYFIAADVGCVLAGVYVTWITRTGWSVDAARKSGYFIFSLLTACGAIIPFIPAGPVMIALLFITAAGILGLHPFYYALTQEISKTRMGVLSGVLAAFAWVISSFTQIHLGQYIEQTQSYKLGLIIVGLVPMLGLLALLLIWPRKRESSAVPLQIQPETA